MKLSNIIILALVLISGLLSLYAYAQKTRAEHSEIEMLLQRELAETATIKALITSDSLNVAKARCESLQEELADCRAKK